VIGEPPSEAGDVQVTFALRMSAVATTPLGAPGTVAGSLTAMLRIADVLPPAFDAVTT
jgi:hypothetical protein